MHLVLKTLVDVQPQSRGFVVLVNSLFNTNRSIPMLLNTLKRGFQGPVSETQFLFVVVDPVVCTGTKKRMLPFEM